MKPKLLISVVYTAGEVGWEQSFLQTVNEGGGGKARARATCPDKDKEGSAYDKEW